MEPIDVLIFGAHPDDVECGIGGTALLFHEQSITFTIVDLTKGEMGSRGTADQRIREAEKAAELLGAARRENLDLGDTALEDSLDSRRRVASVIRKYKPQLVLAPFWDDLHTDHIAAGLMIRNSAVYCSSAKFDDPNPPHKPQLVLYYLLHKYHPPTFIVDISDVYPQKVQAIQCYESQFSKTASEYGVVPVGIGDYLFHLESRNRYFGSLANVRFGEPLVSDQPLRLEGFAGLLRRYN